jgi:hypothetical protein
VKVKVCYQKPENFFLPRSLEQPVLSNGLMLGKRKSELNCRLLFYSDYRVANVQISEYHNPQQPLQHQLLVSSVLKSSKCRPRRSQSRRRRSPSKCSQLCSLGSHHKENTSTVALPIVAGTDCIENSNPFYCCVASGCLVTMFLNILPTLVGPDLQRDDQLNGSGDL